MSDTLELLVARLAARDGPRTEATVQADIRQLLLTADFDLEEHQVVTLEAQAGERRRIDIEVGATVVEVKKDLRLGKVLVDAVEQLKGYVESRQKEFGGRYVGVLTDGAEWRCYHLDRGQLVEVARHGVTASKQGTEALQIWLEGVLATAHDIKPTPKTIEARLGAGSSSHRLDRATLAALYAEYKDAPEVSTKRRLWARLLETALGTQFEDSDALFVEHTLLVNSAEIIAHAVLGLPVASIAPTSLLSGAKFDESGIYGVVEADFFDWVVAVPGGGDGFVRTLARRLGRFDWNAVEHDVLKVLYESVITAETRKKLGEYYTPDWLAQQVVEATVTEPLAQRVLDPSCGSGTFLFHAVRRYLEAAEAEKRAPAEVLDGVTRHVVGMDLHPVAVTLARVTYVLAIGRERLSGERNVIHVPVYLGDSMLWRRKPANLLTGADLVIAADDRRELVEPEFRFPSDLLRDARAFDELVKRLADRASKRAAKAPVPSLTGVFQHLGIAEDARPAVTTTFGLMCRLHDEGRDHIWGYYIRNMARPEWLSRAENRVDVLVGNPPWLSYRYMPAEMQARFKEMCEGRGLWKGGKLSTSQDLSSLFVARVAQLYLKEGGRFGFVMPDAVLDRDTYAGFRSGNVGDARDDVFLDFGTAWNLRGLRPHIFPRGAAVMFGQRAAKARALASKAEEWKGRLPASTSWTDVEAAITRKRSTTEDRGDGEGSPYRSRFRQGAIIVPRVLFMVEKRLAGPLGLPFGKAAIRSKRSATEKPPWKNLPRMEGAIETEFLRPVHLGETVLPYRALTPMLGVIPYVEGELIDVGDTRLDEYPGLADWWQRANQQWETHRVNDKLSLAKQLDYMGKTKAQFPIALQRIVYSKAGMHIAAARVSDHRAVIDHTLYWASVRSAQEAHYLCAVLNSAEATRAVRPLMSFGKDERHIDKYIWQLPIPEFDEEDALHMELAELGQKAEAAVVDLKLEERENFVTARRKVRRLLEELDAGTRIETLVARLLAPPFLGEVYALVREGKERKALTRIFDELDELLLAGEFEACERILSVLEVERLDTSTAVGFLAISLQARDHLRNRKELVERVERLLTQRAPDRVERLMEGLR